MRFGVWGVGCGVWGVGCGVWGVRLGVQGSGFRVQGSGFRVQGSGCMVASAPRALPPSCPPLLLSPRSTPDAMGVSKLSEMVLQPTGGTGYEPFRRL